MTIDRLIANVEEGLDKSDDFSLVITNFDYESSIHLKALKERFKDRLRFLTLHFDKSYNNSNAKALQEILRVDQKVLFKDV